MGSGRYKIASRIELYVGNAPSAGVRGNHRQGVYRRLGHVSLSDNRDKEFKSRELKSVHVDAIGCYVRIVIARNHVNVHNLYNQVGLVAINVLGDGDDSDAPLEDVGVMTRRGADGSVSLAHSNVARLYSERPGAGPARSSPHSQPASVDFQFRSPVDADGGASPGKFGDTVTRSGGVGMIMASGRINYLDLGGGPPQYDDLVDGATLGMINRPVEIDPLDDLAFEVYQDPETAAITRQLARMKQQCVEREDFQKAKQLKGVIDGLRQAGEELGRLIAIKQRAVDAEDYETATMVKQQIDIFRQKVYTSLGVAELHKRSARPATPARGAEAHGEPGTASPALVRPRMAPLGARAGSVRQPAASRTAAVAPDAAAAHPQAGSGSSGFAGHGGRLPSTPPLPGIAIAPTEASSHRGATPVQNTRPASPPVRLPDTLKVPPPMGALGESEVDPHAEALRNQQRSQRLAEERERRLAEERAAAATKAAEAEAAAEVGDDDREKSIVLPSPPSAPQPVKAADPPPTPPTAPVRVASASKAKSKASSTAREPQLKVAKPAPMPAPAPLPLPLPTSPDERPLSGTASRRAAEAAATSPAPVSSPPSAAGSEAPELSDKLRQEAAAVIDVYGDSVASLLWSKAAAHKIGGLEALATAARTLETSSKPIVNQCRGIAAAMAHVLKGTAVVKVIHKACDVLVQIVKVHAAALGKKGRSIIVNSTVKELLRLNGDSAARTRDAVSQGLHELYSLVQIRQSTAGVNAILHAWRSSTGDREAAGQLAVVTRIVRDSGADDSGAWTLAALAAFAARGLKHKKAEIRDAGLALTQALHDARGAAVEPLLMLSPTEDAPALKAVRAILSPGAPARPASGGRRAAAASPASSVASSKKASTEASPTTGSDKAKAKVKGGEKGKRKPKGGGEVEKAAATEAAMEAEAAPRPPRAKSAAPKRDAAATPDAGADKPDAAGSLPVAQAPLPEISVTSRGASDVSGTESPSEVSDIDPFAGVETLGLDDGLTQEVSAMTAISEGQESVISMSDSHASSVVLSEGSLLSDIGSQSADSAQSR